MMEEIKDPLYAQIKNDIQSKILNGEIRVGDKLMSENEMIEYYHAGRVTVRAALSMLVSDGYIKKEHGRGSFCIAVTKKTKRLNIDVLVNLDDTYLLPFIVNGITSVLDRKDCNLLLHNAKNSPEETDRFLREVSERGTNGIIFQHPLIEGNQPFSSPILKRLQNVGIPSVCICGRSLDSSVNLSINDRYGSYIAAMHLLENGHQNILGLFPVENYGVNERLEGVLNAIQMTHKAQFHLLKVEGIQNSEKQFLNALEKHDCTAVICYNDFYAVQIMHVLQTRGIRVPEEISIIGYDDSSLAGSALPPLTTVAHPKEQMGIDAANTLLKLQQSFESNAQNDTAYRPTLIVRETVRAI